MIRWLICFFAWLGVSAVAIAIFEVITWLAQQDNLYVDLTFLVLLSAIAATRTWGNIRPRKEPHDEAR